MFIDAILLYLSSFLESKINVLAVCEKGKNVQLILFIRFLTNDDKRLSIISPSRFERRICDAYGIDGFSGRRFQQFALFHGVLHVQYDVIHGTRPPQSKEQRHGGRRSRRRCRQGWPLSRLEPIESPAKGFLSHFDRPFNRLFSDCQTHYALFRDCQIMIS